LPTSGISVGCGFLIAILGTLALNRTRHGLNASPNKHLKGAANFEEWLADISRATELATGPFWISIGRKLHCTIPSTKMPDSRSRQATVRRFVERSGFMGGFHVLCGSLTTMSRLALYEKMRQEFDWNEFTPKSLGSLTIQQIRRNGGEFGCAVTCFLSRMNWRYK
jgi:hypothetical protein